MRIKEKLMKALKFIGAAATFAVAIPFVSANASVAVREAGAFTISAIDSLTEGTDYSYENNVLKIKSDKAIMIENTDKSVPTADRIVIDIGASANITLAGVNIDTNAGAAFEIAEDNYKTIKITLADGTTNTLKTTNSGCAGLQKNERTSDLKIGAQQKGTGKLIAQGGENAAGIGGGNNHSTMHIKIYGGIINATGGKNGAGIGGGNNGSGDSGIYGGTVTATGGENGAGIGGGNKGNCDYLKIENSTVIATGGENAAGIGGGNSGYCKDIYIHGGKVNATGGERGAGIGGGNGGEGSNIEINGGTITAASNYGGAGIGGGNVGEGSNIKINGGDVTATGGDYAAGIGGGNGKNGSNIKITNGKIIATGGNYAAGIGGGTGGEGSNIEINDGTINATGVKGGAGIGGGSGGEGSNITINDGTITAAGNSGGAGIGGGNYGGAKEVKISGGSVKSTADANANAIGGGNNAVSSLPPTNGSGKNVFLYEIDNQSDADITIDGKAYPSAHGTEKKIYAYLSAGETHTIKVGDKTTYVKYNNGKFVKTTAPSSSTSSRPSRPKPEPVDNPIIGGEEKSWSSVAKEISELSEGEETSISLNGATKIPAEVIKAIKDSKAVVKFKVTSAFSWTVDGSALTDSDIKDIDFEIDLVTPDGTETLRGTVGTSFAIDNITDKAALNISFKQIHAGKFANLYKIVDEKLIFVDNVKIDENGEANGLSVHKSGEYVIMLNELSDRPGDMDNDGILNAKDALAVLKHVVGSINGANPLVADINGDGVINAYDALAVLKMAVKIAV